MTVRHPIQQSLRNVFRRFLVLGAGLLIVGLPGVALAEELDVEDDDPFDRPGFYVGLGGSYQFNVFQDRIEDVISDAFEDEVPGSSASVSLEESGGINAHAGYRAASFFAIELEYEWIDKYDIKGSASIPVPPVSGSGALYSIEGHTLTANTKWIIPFWRIQPYLVLGAGIAISDVDRGDLYDTPAIAQVLEDAGLDIKSGNHTNFAGRAGLGLDLYLTKNIVLNAEASTVLTTLKEPDVGDVDDLNYMSFAAGLQYRF